MNKKYYFLSNPSVDLDAMKHIIRHNDTISFYCINCGKITEIKSYRPNRIDTYKRSMCIHCLKVINNKNHPEWQIKARINYNNKLNSDIEFKMRISKAMTLRNLSPKYQEKCKKGLQKKYSVSYPGELLRSKTFLDKNRNTRKLKYGNENYCNVEKIRKTKFEKYGDPKYNNIEKCKNTISNWTEEEKQKHSLNRSNGRKNMSREAKDLANMRQRETMLKKYGTLSHTLYYNYYMICFDSSWELAVWIYCIDHNIPIVRNPRTFKYYDLYNVLHYYDVDFMINGNLVEIKGPQFWSNRSSAMHYPYTKKKVNGEWISFTTKEKQYMDDLYERKHKCGLANGVEFWKESDCLKYIEYCDTKYPGWNTLYRKDNPYNPSYWCLTINNPGYYQRMYFVPKYINTTNNNRGITPFDCNSKSQYADITGPGLTPFDIKL